MDHPTQPQRRTRRDALENRRQILAAAKRLFADQGVDITSMHEIGQVAGVGQGTLYRHFRNKGEICHTLIKEDIAAFQEQFGPLVGTNGGSPLERLELLLAEKIRLTEVHLPFFAVIEQVSAEVRRPKPKRGPFHIWLHERVSMLLHEAVAAGEATDLDIPVITDFILVIVSPHLYSRQRNEDEFGIERIIAGVRRMCIEGIRSSV